MLTTGEGALVFVGYVDNSKPQRHYTIVGGDNSYVGASGSMIATDKYKEEGIYEIGEVRPRLCKNQKGQAKVVGSRNHSHSQSHQADSF